jgi:hypothetical protein
MRTVRVLLSAFPPLLPGSRNCPTLRRLRQHLKAPRRTSPSCRHGLASLTNRWTLETSSNTWWSPRLDLAAFSPMVSAPGYAWRILPATTLRPGALELRHLGAITETRLPVLEQKVLGVSPLLFCCTKILVIGALKAPSFLRAWAMPLFSPLSTRRTGVITQLPSQTLPEPPPAASLAMHTFRPASIT